MGKAMAGFWGFGLVENSWGLPPVTPLGAMGHPQAVDLHGDFLQGHVTIYPVSKFQAIFWLTALLNQ